ncbi:MAG TPA: MerR family transcriptional regulator, partial [Planctomycetota bacterium]|nr:MerR family transcriptional regulator [Planctomycetota bacterium]
MTKSTLCPAPPRTRVDGLTITQVAQQTTIPESTLRIWEARYGWPRPGRGANNYRRYPQSLIAILQRVAVELQYGRTIGDLLRD